MAPFFLGGGGAGKHPTVGGGVGGSRGGGSCEEFGVDKGGHEATDTWLPNAPVSQATGDCHAMFNQFLVLCIGQGRGGGVLM